MRRRPPRFPHTATLLPATTLCRSQPAVINDPAVAILGQSGGMVGNIRLSCTARALPVSYTISTGNEAVLTINDFVAHIIDDTVPRVRSEEHTSEHQSLMRNSYAVFCLKKKKKQTNTPKQNLH